jgi:hypothetical protein
MRRLAIIPIAGLALLAVPLRAQVADSSPFRQLPLPTPNEYRSASGAPGHAYWQNRADYALEAVLDTAKEEIRGSGRITYQNNSPDPLPFLWLQLDQNIFEKNSINARTSPPPLVFAGTPFDMAGHGFVGGFTITRLEANGKPLPHYIWDTMMRVDLPEPLPPGGAITIDMAWSFPVPVNGAARMGRDGSLYEIAQWYPRMAVYDDVHGWNTLPYIGAGEFYLEYGDFDVRLTVPAGFVVACTGTLQNPDSMLTPAQRERLARARADTVPVQIVTPGEAGDPAMTRPAGPQGMLTWHFRANDVRDVAWAAAPNFRWDAVSWHGVLIQTYYRPSAVLWAAEGIRMAEHAIRHNSELWAMYPYPQASTVEGPIDGMEYPMITFVPAEKTREGLYWVLMHEFGHEWFPMMVGSDERRYPWMDEGFNTFIDLYDAADYFRGTTYGDTVADTPLHAYAANAVPGREQPLIEAPVEVRDLYWTAYQKPALMLRLLRETVLGHEAFDAAFRTYIHRWAFKHPQPADFFRTIENVSGRNLDWYWRDWVYTTARLDQAVDSVVGPAGGARGRTRTQEPGLTGNQSFGRAPEPAGTEPPDVTRVYLSNRLRMVMPATLKLTYADGSSETIDLPVEIWNLGDRFAYAAETGGKRVVRAELDPGHVLPDMDRKNNVWPRGR